MCLSYQKIVIERKLCVVRQMHIYEIKWREKNETEPCILNAKSVINVKSTNPTRCILNESLSQFGLHIIHLFFLQTTVASMLRKTYTPNDDKEKNVPILTNIGIQIGIDGNKKLKNCVIHVKICSNSKLICIFYLFIEAFCPCFSFTHCKLCERRNVKH